MVERPNIMPLVYGLDCCINHGSMGGTDCNGHWEYADDTRRDIVLVNNYRNGCTYGECKTGCVVTLAKDACACIIEQNRIIQAMMEEYMPRVMSLEEVQALHANDVVWLEDKGKPNIIPGIVRNRHLWPHSAAMVTNFMRGDGCKVTAGDDDYGERWRGWTARPDEKTREAAAWNA